ncbi:DUF6541 family protein [Arthrobacter sp. TMP15]|uniref:DUF6541 family protein n=1 Tax=Arthrobacter sp. TMP15 TaxID=3140789 RepID=UPI0031BB919A
MSWWATAPSLMTAAALLLLPGMLLSFSMGARRFPMVAFAPLCSTALVGISGIAGGVLQVAWGLPLLLVVTGVASLMATTLHSVFKRRLLPVAQISGPIWPRALPVVAAMAISCFLIAKWLLESIGNPESFSQAYDNVFHLNAIQHIVQTGNASTLTLGQMISPDKAIAIYPSAWHSFCALVVQLTGVSVFVAENVVTVTVCALVWPLSCIVLVRTLVARQALPVIAAGVLAASFWAFPFQLVQRGPLFPNVLSYAILPAAIVIVAGLLGMWQERSVDKLALSGFLLVAIAALFTAQPNGFTALLAISFPMLAFRWSGLTVNLLRSRSSRSKIMWLGLGGLAGAAVFAVTWTALLIPFQKWQPSRTLPQAAGDIVSGGLLGGSPTWIASILVASGIVAIIVQRRGQWMIGALAIVSFLYIAAAALPSGPLRHTLVGSWYEDSPRLAALVPIVMLPLATAGVIALQKLVAFGVQAAGSSLKNLNVFEMPAFAQTSVPAISTTLVLATALLVPATSDLSRSQNTFITPRISQSWGNPHGDTWVSPDQKTLMHRLGQYVPTDAVIAVNPFNGGALAYAISGRQVSQYSLSSGPRGDVDLLSQAIANRAPIKDLCVLAEKTNIRFILDFGPTYLRSYQASLLYPGFVNIGNLSYVTLVDREGTAKLYEISVCSTRTAALGEGQGP